jgi:IclR family transcriptional regulator, acetate operon repressor
MGSPVLQNPTPVIKKGASETPSIQSLDRGLFILEAVAKSADPVPLGQLTDLLGIDRSSVFRLANTLKRRGFLANPSGRKDYILGPSIWRLSRNHDWSNMLITFSHEHLKRLANQTGETTHLAVREGKQAFFVDHYASTNQLIVVSGQTGEFVPLYCTAHGKALLADCGVPELKAIFGSTPLQAYTPRTVVTLTQLAKACAKIQADGYAVDDQEYVEGVRCMAAPVRDRDDVVIASIGISAPLGRFPRERIPAAARTVVDTAKEISTLLSAETVR